MLAENSPVLKILNEKVNILNLNPAEKKLYESRMMLKSDIVSISNSQFRKGKEEGREEGIKEGIEKGEKKAKVAMAKMMKENKYDVLEIIKLTGLNSKEIEKL